MNRVIHFCLNMYEHMYKVNVSFDLECDFINNKKM